MQVERFKFSDLQDFRHPPVPVDEPEVIDVEEEEELPPPPTFSLEELDAAKKTSFEQGRQTGFDAGRKEADDETSQRTKRIEVVCDHIIGKVSDLDGHLKHYVNHIGAEIHALVTMIARKVAGDVINSIPSASIEAMIDECMGILMTQPKVTLIIHPDLGNHLGEILQERLQKAGIETKLSILPDSSLELSEGRLEWRDGTMARDMAAVWEQIETKLQGVNFADSLDFPKPPPASTARIIDEDAPVIELETANDEKTGENETFEHTNAEEKDSVTKAIDSSDNGEES